MSTRLRAINFGSPNNFTSRPITPPWMNAPITPQKTNSETTVVTGLAASTVRPRLKLSLTSSGSVLSKQLKANVARKKIKISRPIFGCDSVCAHCAKCGRLLAWPESGLQAFGENGEREQKIRRAQRRRRPAGRGDAAEFQRHAADGRAENEAQAERHADEAHPFGAVFRRRDVGDVSLGDGDVAAARAREHARDEQRHRAPAV